MTIKELHGIVRILANQMFVRYYVLLNYPNFPERMGIEFMTNDGKRGWRGGDRLAAEMDKRGFRFNKSLGVWEIERTEP